MNGRTAVLIAVAAATLEQLATFAPAAQALVHPDAGPVPSFPRVLLWNASASVPRGFYRLRAPAPLHRNQLVVITPPAPLAMFLAKRGYLPAGVPLIKHVAALPGQTVCRVAHTITIDERAVAFARDRDHLGRALPAWKGCRTLRAGEMFLLNSNAPDSFDGRYFGPLSAAAITARADPLWTVGKE